MSRASGIESKSSGESNLNAISQVSPGREDLSNRIRARAHELYIDRQANGVVGDALSDWLKAEREVQAVIPRARPQPAEHDQSSVVVVETRNRMRGESLLRNNKE